MFRVLLTERAKKQLRKLDSTTQNRIIAVLERIRMRPFAHIKAVVGESCYRVRAGDYRILIDIQQGELIILVLEVGHRKNIYK
jgi:mRNA interferase RelE/StbE